MTSIPAVVPPLPREHSWKRNVPRAAAFGWLSAGWRDFTIQPAASVSYGVLVFLVSVVTVVGLFALHLDYILFPAFAGFMVVGPVIGIGLYEKSRRIEEGKPVNLWNMIFVKPESGGQILFAGVLLLLLTLLWMRAAVILYALFFGLRPFPGLDRIVPMLFTTEIGWAMLVVGGAVGGLFAAFAFAIQRLFHSDAAERAHRCADRHGHQHGAGVAQSSGHADLGGDHACADFCRHGHGPSGNDRRFPGAGTRKLARLSDHAVLSFNARRLEFFQWVVAVRELNWRCCCRMRAQPARKCCWQAAS